jgi:hypothetical protein
MVNWIKSDDPAANDTHKLKYGADLLATPLKWPGVGARFDRVQPSSSIPQQSFSILSPRIVFKTAWVTHEEVMFQYSRYIYNSRTCPGAGQVDSTKFVAGPNALLCA